MTDKSVLILAAGEQSRWEDPHTPKQLMWAGPERIIDRIVRQVRERGHEPIIVTHKWALMRPGVEYVCPMPRRWKVESLWIVKGHWGKQSTLVLLGDVIFQSHVIDRIFENSDSTMFFGNYAEIFAYSFSNYPTATKMLRRAYQECTEKGDKGTMHSLFRAYINNFIAPGIERQKRRSPLFTFVTGDGGWTRDIDSQEDYDRFLEEVIYKDKLDDLPRSNH